MRSSGIRATVLASVTLVAVAMAGCAESNPPPPPAPVRETTPLLPDPAEQVTDTAPTQASVTHLTAAGSCPVQWTPLTVVTDVPDEVPYVADVAACVSPDGLSTYLGNQGDGVWVPTTTRTWPVRTSRNYRSQLARARADAYLASMREVYAYDLLTPGEWLVVPVAPAELTWGLNIGYSLSWHLHEAMLSEIQGATQQGLVNALDRRTRRGAAVAECTINLYKVIERQPDLTDAAKSTRMLAAVSDTADGATCLQKWREADRAAKVSQAGDDVVVTAEHLPTALRTRQAQILSTADSYLGRFSSATKVVRLALHK